MAETAKSRFRMYVSLAAAALLLTFSLITASTEVVHGADTVCNGSCYHSSWQCDGGMIDCMVFACCDRGNLPCTIEDLTDWMVCGKSSHYVYEE